VHQAALALLPLVLLLLLLLQNPQIQLQRLGWLLSLLQESVLR
jgi:hypothetical protein